MCGRVGVCAKHVCSRGGSLCEALKVILLLRLRLILLLLVVSLVVAIVTCFGHAPPKAKLCEP